MTPTPPPETSDERRLQDDAEKRVYESKVCSRFSTAMGQPHCQTCGRNEDLHTIRGLLKALAAERSSREAHALPREVQDAIKFIELLVGECDPGTSDHAWRKCKRCLAIHEVQNNGRPAMRLLKAAVDRLGLAQQAGESARLREALKAKAEEWRERGDYIKANAEFADANLTPSHSERGDAFIEMADELDALLSSPVSPQTPQKHRLEPISTSADNRPSPIIPQIPLDDAAQEQIAKQWAADDRLWTTQETVAFNLRVFARAIIASKPAASEDCIQTSDAAMTLHYYGRPLTVKVENGQLVIAIGVQTLAHAVTYSEWANQWEDEAGDYFRTFAITDAVEFGKDVVHAMLNEREDGSTPLSDFLDRMTEAAVEDGSVSCEYEQHIPNGTTAASETWAADEQEREGEEPR
jgi:hypothetical protein